MENLTGGVTAILPWGFVLGLFGLFFKARLSGDPALWKRVEQLEKKLEDQRTHFEAKLEAEQEACARQISHLEGQIREFQQVQASFGNMSKKPLGGSLDAVYKVHLGDTQDDDLIEKLDEAEGEHHGKKVKRTRPESRNSRISGD